MVAATAGPRGRARARGQRGKGKWRVVVAAPALVAWIVIVRALRGVLGGRLGKGKRRRRGKGKGRGK